MTKQQSRTQILKKRTKKKERSIWFSILMWLFILIFLAVIAGCAAITAGFFYLSQDLPQINTLNDYRPAIVTNVFSDDGRKIGEELGNHYMSQNVPYDVDGSVMIIVATDAPVTSRNLERLAKRAFLGVARVGGFASNGSGDYVIAFSTHPDVRRDINEKEITRSIRELTNSAMTPLFLAAVEATEEAILNSLFMAETMKGVNGRVQEALPLEAVLKNKEQN